MSFKQILPEDFAGNSFSTIGKDWLLVTAEKEGKVNSLTASWGGMGVLWNKDVAFIFLRPQRYTKEFVDSSAHFSLSVLPESYRKVLSYMGTVSGRDEDKISKSGLTTEFEKGTPYFAEADTVFICKKLYVQPLEENCFEDCTIYDRNYPKNDLHTMYIAEIEKVLIKE